MTVPIIVHPDVFQITPRTRRTLESVVTALAAQGVVRRTSGALVAREDLDGMPIDVPRPIRSQWEMLAYLGRAVTLVQADRTGERVTVPAERTSPIAMALARRLLADRALWAGLSELVEA